MVRRLRPLLAHLAAQLLAIGVLSAIDALRTRYRSQGAIPRLPLPPVRIGDSAVQLYTDAVQLYTDGADLYAAMLHAIAQARTQILLETSIWKDDPVGRRFKQQLHRAATRGVTVYVSFDSVANRVVPRRVTRFAPPSRCSNSPCCRGPGCRGPGCRGPGCRGPGCRGPGIRCTCAPTPAPTARSGWPTARWPSWAATTCAADAVHTQALTLEDWQRRSLLEKLAEALLLPLRPLL